MKVVQVNKENVESVFVEDEDMGYLRLGMPRRVEESSLNFGVAELWYKYSIEGLLTITSLDRVNELNAAYAKFKQTTEGK